MADTPSSALLLADGVQLRANAAPIQFALYPGEIVGLAGLDGHGQEAFLEALAGLHAPLAGRIVARGEAGDMPIRDIRGAARAGLAYLPRNRKTEGVLSALSVLDNFSIATIGKGGRFGLFNRRAQRQALAGYQGRLSMVYASPDAPITSLSGGNQQKVLLARWMAAHPRAMLLNDPTRGVDLRTRLTLYDVFRALAAEEGMALVVLSTEIEEILRLCRRALVFRDGGVFAELTGDGLTMNAVIAAMFGRGG